MTATAPDAVPPRPAPAETTAASPAVVAEQQGATAATPVDVPLIKSFALIFRPGDGGLPPEQVASLRALLDDERMHDGRIGHESSKATHLDRAVRAARVQWLFHKDVDPAIYRRLHTLAVVANREQGWNFGFDGIAQYLQATQYGAGGDHYDWHLDWGGGRTQFRKISLVVHLSEPSEFTGGRLQLTWGSHPLECAPPAGSVTVFPSFLLHRVTPVTGGSRVAAVAWMLGQSFH
jgi:PKHD-type hydroxylase